MSKWYFLIPVYLVIYVCTLAFYDWWAPAIMPRWLKALIAALVLLFIIGGRSNLSAGPSVRIEKWNG